jgi:hypothetical protein
MCVGVVAVVSVLVLSRVPPVEGAEVPPKLL